MFPGCYSHLSMPHDNKTKWICDSCSSGRLKVNCSFAPSFLTHLHCACNPCVTGLRRFQKLPMQHAWSKLCLVSAVVRIVFFFCRERFIAGQSPCLLLSDRNANVLRATRARAGSELFTVVAICFLRSSWFCAKI